MQYFAYAFCLIGLIALLLLIFSPKLFKQKRKSLWDSPGLKYSDAAWDSCGDGKIKPWNASCDAAITREDYYAANPKSIYAQGAQSAFIPSTLVKRINKDAVNPDVMAKIESGEIPAYYEGDDLYFRLLTDFVVNWRD